MTSPLQDAEQKKEATSQPSDIDQKTLWKVLNKYSENLKKVNETSSEPDDDELFREEKKVEIKNLSQEGIAEQQYKVLLAQEELKEKRLHNTRLEDTIELRKGFARRIFIFVVLSSMVVASIVIASASKVQIQRADNTWIELFSLSDNVLMTLITAATVNLMAGLIIIVKNLFPEDKNK
ncbi:hypothetical protein [Endozoicomonas numazuensis]|uniref:Uncharacterized protein n=1 Tax=Endozoicomonas numazuensis TaxID=1137799 RepID=A0A081NI51_9GAMM|nr:hypothetical protein [Endozoicomonas numazuensis]KEQ18124.1 hypothetical protein GZ78_11200 [Endozoicomonas numazuensis]